MNEYTRPLWNPTIVEDTFAGRSRIDLQTKLFSERKLFICGDITDELADDFVKDFLFLTQSDKPVYIYINSPGGSVDSGLVIYDVIQGCRDKLPIYTFCTGMAGSMAAVLFTSGEKGKRYILPHSRVMLHEPFSGCTFGTSVTSARKMADSMFETKKTINTILSRHTGRTMEEIDEATSFDNFMTAKEAVDFGLCDEIRYLN